MEGNLEETRPGERRRRVSLVVPFLSEFRRPFYQRLEEDLDARGMSLTIAYGAPYSEDQVARRDVIDIDGAVRVRQACLWLAGRPLVHKRLGSLIGSSDVLVVDQSLRNLELYPLLLRQSAGFGPKIAMWDHGRTYTRPQSRLEQSLKYALTRRACWFFAYTDGGARAVTDHGFPRQRVTVVQNAIDSSELQQATQALTEDELARFRAQHGLVAGRTGLFLGALSPSKRLPFLIEAAEAVAERLPGFKLLVAGAGPDGGLVEEAAARTPAVVSLGQVFGEHKALLGAVADVLLMPGLVGLCAVDSFALQTPIVTTAWPWHAPEFEYLEDGRNAVIAPNDPHQYADTVVELLSTPPRLEALRQGCRSSAPHYTVQEMSRRFADGLGQLFREGGR
jgi:glycosyltransferase involved in cell wall biosynthesis